MGTRMEFDFAVGSLKNGYPERLDAKIEGDPHGFRLPKPTRKGYPSKSGSKGEKDHDFAGPLF